MVLPLKIFGKYIAGVSEPVDEARSRLVIDIEDMSDGSSEVHVLCLCAFPIALLKGELHFCAEAGSDVLVEDGVVKHKSSTTYNFIIGLNLTLVLGLIESDTHFEVPILACDGVDASIETCISTLELICVEEIVIHSSDVTHVSCVPSE